MEKMLDFRNFRMPDGKCRKNIKMMDFRFVRMSDSKCRKMMEIMDFRICRMSDLQCRKHQKESKQVKQLPPGPVFDTCSIIL